MTSLPYDAPHSGPRSEAKQIVPDGYLSPEEGLLSEEDEEEELEGDAPCTCEC